VGVSKDGLLHVSEVRWLIGSFVQDLREYVRVGEKLRLLYVLDIDESKGRFTLTSRAPPSEEHPAAEPARPDALTKHKEPVSAPSVKEVFPALAAAEEAGIEATTFAKPATVGDEAGEDMGEHGGSRPTAASVVQGVEAVPLMTRARPLRVVATVVIRGTTRILYDMPWKGQ